MKSAVIVYPGINRERDLARALELVTGTAPYMVWHDDAEIPDVDLIAVPGGFSYGDYLRCGAIAGQARITADLKKKAAKGVRVFGVCNGFQILTEIGLLPGALLRNAHLKFVCKEVKLEVVNNRTAFTNAYTQGQIIRCPVAHHDGNYFADEGTIRKLEDEHRVVFRYAEGTNPNGSINDIAGIINEKGNVLGMMPHPENLVEPLHGGLDGRGIFESLLETVA
jgi:phosphoribosylformylglycinamidine synthase